MGRGAAQAPDEDGGGHVDVPSRGPGSPPRLRQGGGGAGADQAAGIGSAHAHPDSVKTRSGVLSFERGYPTQDTDRKLYDELDYQRAVQVYLCGPIRRSFESIRIAGGLTRSCARARRLQRHPVELPRLAGRAAHRRDARVTPVVCAFTGLSLWPAAQEERV